MARRIFALLLAGLLLLGWGPAAAQTTGREILLPDGQSVLTLPEDMVSTPVSPEESDLWADYQRKPDLEMLIFTYRAGNSDPRKMAETLVEAGRTAEVREIGGVEFLVFQDRDEADGALCVGYAFVSGETLIEITFFYGSQEAMDRTYEIMESFHQ